MKNQKTTIAGFLSLAAALLTVGAAFLTGGDVITAFSNALVPALAGLGLIGAADGGV